MLVRLANDGIDLVAKNGAGIDSVSGCLESVFRKEDAIVSSDLDGAVIAIFEKLPYWGPELQRQLQLSRVTLIECRSVRDLFPSIVNFETVLVVVDLDAGLTDCIEWLGTRHSKPVPIVAIGSPTTAELEWILREAGVTAFLSDTVTGDDLAQLCRRQLSRQQ